MRLIPYLHAAFVRYRRQGLPPFRGLVMDYPEDAATWAVDNQFLMGDALMVAPAFAGEVVRGVYLPAGDWYDFWSGKRHSGQQRIEVRPGLEEIPIYVKAGTALPLAEATLHTDDPNRWRLRVQVYGSGVAHSTIYEDDGSWMPGLNEVTLAWDGQRGGVSRAGGVAGARYEVIEWKRVDGA